MIASCRIHVIGGPGSGKTTLARRLAGELALAHVDLDTVGYEHGAGAKRPLAQRLADVEALSTTDAWITEGIFLWWTDALLQRADVIVWLDVPWRVAARRIVVRHACASLSGTNRHRGLRRLGRFLGNARRYYIAPAIDPAALDDDAAVTRAATAAVLSPYSSKVVRCRTDADVDRWLAAYIPAVAFGTSSP